MNSRKAASEANATEHLAWFSPDDDPARHSAIEEACLRDSQSSFLILWINRPSLFVGKNQNLWAQVSAKEASQTGVSLNRRLSGGGAVYHDPGNLNFSLISPGESRIAFQKHLALFLPYFEARDIPVQIRNRSDMFHGDSKFSGNAEYFTNGRVLHHGTLLFDTDLSQMDRLLTPDSKAYDDRAIDSNRSRTLNLRSLLPDLCDTRSFAEDLLGFFLERNPHFRRIGQLPDSLLQRSRDYLPRFLDPDWIFGRAPQYQLERTFARTPWRATSRVTVENGRISSIALTFDSAHHSIPPIADSIADALIGCLHSPDPIRSRLRNVAKCHPDPAVLSILSEAWLDILF